MQKTAAEQTTVTLYNIYNIKIATLICSAENRVTIKKRHNEVLLYFLLKL